MVLPLRREAPAIQPALFTSVAAPPTVLETAGAALLGCVALLLAVPGVALVWTLVG